MTVGPVNWWLGSTTTLFCVTMNANCPTAAGVPAPGSRKNKNGLFEIPCAPFCGCRSTGAKGKIIRPAKSIKLRTEIGGGGGVSPTFSAIPITVFDPRSRAYWTRLMSVNSASQVRRKPRTPKSASVALSNDRRCPIAIIDCYHCKLTRIGIKSCPVCNGRNALPITDPKAFTGSLAFMACPGVGDVVSRSPTSIPPNAASTLQ